MDRNLSLATRAIRADPHRLVRSLDDQTRALLLETLFVYQRPTVDQLVDLIYRLDLNYDDQRRLREAIADWRRHLWVGVPGGIDRLDVRKATTEGLQELLRLHTLRGIAPPNRRVRLLQWQVIAIEDELRRREIQG